MISATPRPQKWGLKWFYLPGLYTMTPAQVAEMLEAVRGVADGE